MSIKILTFGIFLSLTFSAYATHRYYPSKVDDVITKRVTIKSKELKKYLRTVLIRNHANSGEEHDRLVNNCANEKNCYRFKVFSYKEARRNLFGNIHLKEDDRGYYVKDVYCNQVYRNGPTSSIGPKKIPNSNILNCEHTWPQSRFNQDEAPSTQKTDLHHLYPTNSRANSIRGNNEFAEVNGDTIFPMCENSYTGDLRVIKEMTSKKRKIYFEPPNEHKGNVARALFYFSTRYLNPISSKEEAFLRKWHNDDPVDKEEIKRNETIFSLQANRNPFIDHPELVEMISDF